MANDKPMNVILSFGQHYTYGCKSWTLLNLSHVTVIVTLWMSLLHPLMSAIVSLVMVNAKPTDVISSNVTCRFITGYQATTSIMNCGISLLVCLNPFTAKLLFFISP